MSEIKILNPKHLTDEILTNDIEKATFVVIYHSSRKKHVKQFIDNFNEDNEKIVYAHRYPKDKETFIGIKRIEDSNYFI